MHIILKNMCSTNYLSNTLINIVAYLKRANTWEAYDAKKIT